MLNFVSFGIVVSKKRKSKCLKNTDDRQVMIIQNLLGQVIEVKHHHHTSMLEMKT
jgi:hypothetical protein